MIMIFFSRWLVKIADGKIGIILQLRSKMIIIILIIIKIVTIIIIICNIFSKKKTTANFELSQILIKILNNY